MLGDGAMIKMAQSKVFLSGLGGLGIEIGKILLANASAKEVFVILYLRSLNQCLRCESYV